MKMPNVFNGVTDVSSKLDDLALFFARLLSGSQLHSEPQTGMVRPAVLDQLMIPVIEMKIPGQLGWRRVFGIAPIAALLVLGQELNRHTPPSLNCKVSAKQHDPLGVTCSDVGNGLLPYTKRIGENCTPPFWGTIA